MTMTDPASRKGTNTMLWIAQILLAALFLFAGGSKFVMSTEVMTQGTKVPGGFIRFIGVLELLGGLGMILPWLLRLNPVLTPLAAAGLVALMCGAFATTIVTMGISSTLVVPVVTGLVAAFVAYGRGWLVPLRVRGAGTSELGTRPAV